MILFYDIVRYCKLVFFHKTMAMKCYKNTRIKHIDIIQVLNLINFLFAIYLCNVQTFFLNI